jgi:hypothetical protein
MGNLKGVNIGSMIMHDYDASYVAGKWRWGRERYLKQMNLVGDLAGTHSCWENPNPPKTWNKWKGIHPWIN